MANERGFSSSDLTAAMQTALIPLVARARARTLFPDLGFTDPEAERIVRALGIPLDTFGNDRGWLLGSVLRAMWFDDRCREFFSAHPDGLGIALGAGLDTRFRRLDAADTARWVDIDLPETIALRRRFVGDAAHCRMLAADIADPAWMERIGWRPGTPLMLTAEGLLMYLAPSHVHTLFRGVAAHFSDGGGPVSFLFDYASPLMVLNSPFHPAVAHTRARFRWSLVGAEAIRFLDPRYRVVEDYDISRECGFPTVFISLAHQLATMGRAFYGLAHMRLPAHTSTSP